MKLTGVGARTIAALDTMIANQMEVVALAAETGDFLQVALARQRETSLRKQRSRILDDLADDAGLTPPPPLGQWRPPADQLKRGRGRPRKVAP